MPGAGDSPRSQGLSRHPPPPREWVSKQPWSGARTRLGVLAAQPPLQMPVLIKKIVFYMV